ncbi:hypothetical protein TRIP_E350018 [uncultured Spirochaetota bacterium]|uniref:Uncharacterized protein n=1 Tax=uncultured Spirochaetota bacterium TaxID=460511 RepID=A0A652ZY52_9SPIR|nr:hypothetical protein TRIP_E350018 [uncultured Spirochaetota bacterium]
MEEFRRPVGLACITLRGNRHKATVSTIDSRGQESEEGREYGESPVLLHGSPWFKAWGDGCLGGGASEDRV